jgi:hypothetical protein
MPNFPGQPCVFTGRGWGEGLYPRTVPLEEAPLTRPPSRSLSSGARSRDPVASPGDLSPARAGRGDLKRFALSCFENFA